MPEYGKENSEFIVGSERIERISKNCGKFIGRLSARKRKRMPWRDRDGRGRGMGPKEKELGREEGEQKTKQRIWGRR